MEMKDEAHAHWTVLNVRAVKALACRAGSRVRSGNRYSDFHMSDTLPAKPNLRARWTAVPDFVCERQDIRVTTQAMGLGVL